MPAPSSVHVKSLATGPDHRNVHEPAEDGDNPRLTPTSPQTGVAESQRPSEEDEDEGEDERMDIKLIQGFADKVQHLPSGSGGPTRTKIAIPKRGEKDFEPLQTTVNLQEMMLQRSREALFNALIGVRGGGSRSMSHALVTPGSSYPRLLIARGHLFDSIGVSIRAEKKGSNARMELLPEEALYLLERGTLQIWVGRDAETPEDVQEGVGEWKDEVYGIGGAVEMSVVEGFGTFIGKDGLSWERYQAYAYLKRLGYTVQRTRQFLPLKFSGLPPGPRAIKNTQDPRLPPFHTWWLSIPRWVSLLLGGLAQRLRAVASHIGKLGLHLDPRRILTCSRPFSGALLASWHGTTYSSLFAHLRVVPNTHSHPLPPRPVPSPAENLYAPLDDNPYLPFYNVWKPATPWSKVKWDKGSEAGLARQKPDYAVAVIEARATPLPTIHQLAEVFDALPDEPKGPTRKSGPQYERRPPARSRQDQTKSLSWLERLGLKKPVILAEMEGNPMGAIRNGDRALIVAVNDSGNTGWVRFGRTGFAGAVII